MAVEGANELLVRQVDEVGNASDEALLEFLFDTTTPAALGVALTQDTGISATDLITRSGSLTVTGKEAGDATIQYSTDEGATWAVDFTPTEGVNRVFVRQLDVAGVPSDSTLIEFTLDSQVASPSLKLQNDTGKSSTDQISMDGTLSIGGLEQGAKVDYSINGGTTWTTTFTAKLGANSVKVRQTDLAGNVNTSASLTFTLDTTAPLAPKVALTKDSGVSTTDKLTNVGTLAVTGLETDATAEYSTGVTPTATSPLLVNQKSVTGAPNASDAAGIATQAAGAVNTTAAGVFSLKCTATDKAGNVATVSVPYVVGYAVANLSPLANASFSTSATIPVSFQLKDANGVLTDTIAAGLVTKLVVMWDSTSYTGVTYNKTTKTFSYNLKPTSPALGQHTLGIRVVVNGADVTRVSQSITIV